MLDAATGSRTLISLAVLGMSLGMSASAHAQLAGDPPVAEAPPEPPPPPPPAAAPGGLKLEANGASLRLGFLVQPAFEYTSAAINNNLAQSAFFLRRMRLMAAMTVGPNLEFFFETDSPNVGKGGVQPIANVTPATLLQDAFVTWKPMDELKLDGGMMLIPFGHNSVQGATTLYAWDYFASSFMQSAGYQNFAGRDIGIQARGLVIGKLEYRLGVFTGKRNAINAPVPPAMMGTPRDRAILRLAGRIQFNLFDAETAYFYAGTYGGAKKIVSFGVGADHQDTYNGITADAFVDLPVGNDVFTAQAAFFYYSGGTWMTLPVVPEGPWATAKKVTAVVAEAGYRINQMKVSPILRFEHQTATSEPITSGMPPTTQIASPNVLRFSAGLSYWAMNHTANVKLFYTYVKPSDSVNFKTYNQLNLQVQFYVF
jgi:hypothetical protein